MSDTSAHPQRPGTGRESWPSADERQDRPALHAASGREPHPAHGRRTSHRRLSPVIARRSLPAYLRATWSRHSMVRAMAVTALRSANSLDRLGSAWLVLTPLFLAALYYFAFGVLLGTGRGIDNFVGFLIVGVFLFQYAARILGEGSKSITASRRLIRGFHFPRLVLPLAVVVRLMLAFVPALVALLGIALATVPPQNVTWRWLLVVPAVLLLTAFCTGLMLVLARLTSQVHDLANVIPFFVRGWMYFSGVFYSVERFTQDATARAVLEANPMHIYLTLARDAVLYAQGPSTDGWTAGAAWAAGTCVVGLIVFWRGEESYSRE